MFKDATLGLVANPMGVSRHCVECRAAGGEHDEVACTGFGPGCLVPPRAAANEPAGPEDAQVRFTTK